MTSRQRPVNDSSPGSLEMPVAGAPKRERPAVGVHDRDALPVLDGPDAAHGELEAPADRLYGTALGQGRAEEQLVVVAAGHEVGDRRLTPVDSAPDRRRQRHGVRIDARRDPRFLAEVAEVGDETV